MLPRIKAGSALITLGALGFVLLGTQAQAQDLFVLNQTHHAFAPADVLRFNGATGLFEGNSVPNGSGGLGYIPTDLRFGPDGSLFVADSEDVLRYSGQTGAFLNTFISPGSGGLTQPHDLRFGPDGDLFLSNQNEILRYNGRTGAFVSTFVPPGSGGLDSTSAFTFGPDGNLYVASAGTNSILRYNGQTGAFLNTFIPGGSGGLSHPEGVVFGPDGSLYVTTYNDTTHAYEQVLRYNGQTGAFLNTFVSALDGTSEPVFGPDGNLYEGQDFGIARYNGLTGASEGLFVSFANAGSSDLFFPASLTFGSPAAVVPEAGLFSVVAASLLCGLGSAFQWRRQGRDDRRSLLALDALFSGRRSRSRRRV